MKSLELSEKAMKDLEWWAIRNGITTETSFTFSSFTRFFPHALIYFSVITVTPVQFSDTPFSRACVACTR